MSLFIYGLCDPRNGEIRYIGKTNRLKYRLHRHITDDESNYKGNWIQSLVRIGMFPTIEVIEETDECSWREAERFWIVYLRFLGCRLTNTSQGGIGGTMPPEVRAKISLARRGKTLSAAAREKVRQAQLGRRRGPLSAEHRAKIAAGNRGKKKPKSPEWTRRIGEAVRKTWERKRDQGLVISRADQYKKKLARNLRYYHAAKAALLS